MTPIPIIELLLAAAAAATAAAAAAAAAAADEAAAEDGWSPWCWCGCWWCITVLVVAVDIGPTPLDCWESDIVPDCGWSNTTTDTTSSLAHRANCCWAWIKSSLENNNHNRNSGTRNNKNKKRVIGKFNEMNKSTNEHETKRNEKKRSETIKREWRRSRSRSRSRSKTKRPKCKETKSDEIM